MKIKHLWISEYKNIQDINLYFESDLISLLVGQNGLGKSNLLEAVALIFRDLDLLDNKEDFENWYYIDDHFQFNITYECKGSRIRIICNSEKFEVSKNDLESSDDLLVIDFDEFLLNKQNYLPDFIIGYYSGENKRVKAIINKYEELIFKDLKSNKGLENGFRKIFFAQDFHGPLVLLTLLLYKDISEDQRFKDAVNRLFNDFLCFSDLTEFGLQLKSPYWYNPKQKSHRKQGIENLEENVANNALFPFWNAKGKANSILTLLFQSNEAILKYYNDEETFGTPKEILELDAISFHTMKVKLKQSLPRPIDFFDSFETLFLIDSVSSIHLNLKAKVDGLQYSFAQLSEGEQQLLCVLGLILITGKDDCLFLLDEPDTHLNPKWQRDYVTLLRDFNLNDENSHIIVATHSPLIVQSAEKADIMLYRRCANGNAEVVNNDKLKIHNWRIDQVLASEYFEFDSTRPPSLDGYMALREKILAEGEISDELEQKLNELENEFGVLPTGETIDEIRALLLVKSLAKKLE